jgi:hypothetical protein
VYIIGDSGQETTINRICKRVSVGVSPPLELRIGLCEEQKLAKLAACGNIHKSCFRVFAKAGKRMDIPERHGHLITGSEDDLANAMANPQPVRPQSEKCPIRQRVTVPIGAYFLHLWRVAMGKLARSQGQADHQEQSGMKHGHRAGPYSVESATSW